MFDDDYLRESYRRFEVTDIGLILGRMNIADAFTMDGSNKALDQLMICGMNNTVIDQLVVRDNGAPI